MSIASIDSPILTAREIATPLGNMVAVADESALYLLEFTDRKGFSKQVFNLGIPIVDGNNALLGSIESELAAYFEGSLQCFSTPLKERGTPFQKQVWGALKRIPYGHTCSYAEQALAIGKPTAYRAVANANGLNPLAIVVPCHRILNSNGQLGGYAGGLSRKEWLLSHEKSKKKMI